MGVRAYDGLEGEERAVIRAGCGTAPVRGMAPARDKVRDKVLVHDDGKALARDKTRDGVYGGVSDGRDIWAHGGRENAVDGRTTWARHGWGSGGRRVGEGRGEA